MVTEVRNHPSYNTSQVLEFYKEYVREVQLYGQHNAVGYCPFHDDKHKKSFGIDLVSGYFKCFSPVCSQHGGISTFVKLLGVTKPSWLGGTDFGAVYNQLGLSNVARDYILRRGISQQYLTYLADAKLVKSDNYEDVEWVVFPIFNLRGHVVAINKVSTQDSDKRVHGSYLDCYWIDTNFKFENTIYLVEGVINAITLNDLGLNCLSLITAGNTLSSVIAKDRNLILLLDNDSAGRKAVRRVSRELQDIAKSVKFVEWPNTLAKGFDPNDAIRKLKHADELLAHIIATASEVNEWSQFKRFRSLVRG